MAGEEGCESQEPYNAMSCVLASSLLAVCSFILIEGSGHWSYEGDTGPDHWCDLAEGCCGQSQSPIALDADSPMISNGPFEFENYDTIPQSMIAENNGHSVTVRLDGNSETPSVSGGGLPGTYKFNSLHFHWGSSSRQGSEHTMYGKAYPMELHLVHYNSKFADFTSAVNSKESDALAVLGVMFNLALDNNSALDNLVKQLSEVTNFGQSTTLTTPFALSSLLPDETRLFFRYTGSLTTPGCNQVVLWTVFFQPVSVSESQLGSFRSLLTSVEGDTEHRMTDNFRPVQELNGRTFYLVVANK